MASPVYPSQGTLADLCAVSIDTIERRVRRLRERGYVEVERRAITGGKRVNHYTRRGLDQALLKLELVRLEQEANPAAVRGSREDGDPAPMRDSTTFDPAPMRATDPARMRATDPARMRDEVETGYVEAGKQTGPGARELAATVLRVFNELAGTAYSGDGHVRQIAAVVEARSDLTLDEHRTVIERNLREPWWEGQPSPAVIYKSLEQFERALHHDGREGGKRRAKPWAGALRDLAALAVGSGEQAS